MKDGPWEPSVQQLEMYRDYVNGDTHPEIGARLELTAAAVCHTVRKVTNWLWETTFDDIRDIKAVQVSRFMLIYREAMDAWNKSKDGKVSETKSIKQLAADLQKAKGNKTGRNSERIATKKTEFSAGDPRYLEVAIKALDEICRIMGAYAPVEIKHSGEMRVAGLPYDEALRQRRDMYDRMIAPKQN